MNKDIKSILYYMIIGVMFLVSTYLLLYQHYSSLSWDFSSYVLNGKYFFHNGNFFSTLRPPIAPIILGLFYFLGPISEYLYIILSAILFLYSSIILSDVIFQKGIKSEKISTYFSRFVFYALSLGLTTLRYGTSAGTELLTLALLELAIANMFLGKNSGIYLALAFLTKYNSLIFFPILFFNKDIHKILMNILSFCSLVFLWFLYNFIKYGNWFTSFIDAYAINVYNRSYIHIPFNFMHVVNVIGYFLPLLILGLILGIVNLVRIKNKWFFYNKYTLFFLSVMIYVIYDYSNIPLREPRYLFNLILPVAFFSSLLIFFISIRLGKSKHFFTGILIILFVIFSYQSYALTYSQRDYDNQFYNATNDIQRLGIKNCEIQSPLWVPMNYLSGNVYPLDSSKINQTIESNKIVLIFKDEITFDDKFTKKRPY